MVSKADQENRTKLVLQLKALRPNFANNKIVGDVAKLGKIGKRAASHAEQMCSDESYYNRHTGENGEDALDEKLEAQANAIAAEYGLTAVTVGDPRGFVLYLRGPGIRGNTWGGDEHGFGVN